MSLYYPEGWIIDTPQNRAAMANISTLTDACHEGQILEGRALICDSAHNLIVDLKPPCLFYDCRFSKK